MSESLRLITFSANSQTKKGTVLLGAGSQFSETEWTDWSITPRVGYFIQDGLAIGAEIHFDTDDEYFPAFNGYLTANPDFVVGGNEDPFIVTGEHSDYTLTNNTRMFGVFARYYAARNLFMEVSLNSGTTQTEEWAEDVEVIGLDGFSTEQDMVLQTRTQSSHVRFGMGYTLVWREHFAVEPFVHLDLIVDGERVNPATKTTDPVTGVTTTTVGMMGAETTDLSGSEFIAGINFSLFF